MCKSIYQKSAQCAFNNAAQAIVAAGTPIEILGRLVCDTGCSIKTDNGGFTIYSNGLYRFSFDITATAISETAGSLVLQLYNGTDPLPCATETVSVVQNDVEPLHVETTLQLHSCDGVRPMINAVLSGVTATVSHVCASAIKLA